MPGYYNGPGDAIRHVIGTAELRRRAGTGVAWLVANSNEWLGEIRGHRPELTATDQANNAIGLDIGAKARTYAEVVAMAREVFRRGVEANGSGADGTPVWRPRSEWRNAEGGRDVPLSGSLRWLDREPGGGTYRFGGIEHAFLRGPRDREAKTLDDLAHVPPEHWTETDARFVIRSLPCRNSRDPSRKEWQARARAFFEAKQGREATGAADRPGIDGQDCTGSTEVRAHTRAGPNGRPVQVGAHQRAVPCP